MVESGEVASIWSGANSAAFGYVLNDFLTGNHGREQNFYLVYTSIYRWGPEEQWDTILTLQELGHSFWLRQWQGCPHLAWASSDEGTCKEDRGWGSSSYNCFEH